MLSRVSRLNLKPKLVIYGKSVLKGIRSLFSLFDFCVAGRNVDSYEDLELSVKVQNVCHLKSWRSR